MKEYIYGLGLGYIISGCYTVRRDLNTSIIALIFLYLNWLQEEVADVLYSSLIVFLVDDSASAKFA